MNGRERGRESKGCVNVKRKEMQYVMVSGRKIRGNSEWKEGKKRKAMRMTRCGFGRANKLSGRPKGKSERIKNLFRYSKRTGTNTVILQFQLP